MTAATTVDPERTRLDSGSQPRRPWHQRLRLNTMSALYLLVAELIIFALWLPETFLTTTTLQGILNEQAVTALVAVGLVLPLAAGAFDLSVGACVGMAAIVITRLTVVDGWNVFAAVAVTLAVGLLIGAVNGFLVVVAKIDSFITTLAMSSVLAAAILAVSGNRPAVGVPEGLTKLGATQIFGIQLPVFYLAVLALVVWFVLEHTTVGRYIYATGGGIDAARLAGVRTGRILAGVLVCSAAIAALAGIVVTARVGAGSPDVGPPYLLPAFAAAFLGATQFKPGRYNVLGTVLAVYVLAVGVKGLQLAGAPFWLPDLFNGVALLLAVGLTTYERRGLVSRKRRAAESKAKGTETSPGELTKGDAS